MSLNACLNYANKVEYYTIHIKREIIFTKLANKLD